MRPAPEVQGRINGPGPRLNMGGFTACLCRSCGLGEAPDARDFPSSLYSEASPREIKSQSAELPAKKMSNKIVRDGGGACPLSRGTGLTGPEPAASYVSVLSGKSRRVHVHGGIVRRDSSCGSGPFLRPVVLVGGNPSLRFTGGCLLAVHLTSGTCTSPGNMPAPV